MHIAMAKLCYTFLNIAKLPQKIVVIVKKEIASKLDKISIIKITTKIDI